MIDIESRKIIDIIETRELEQITQWLKEYPNLKIVSRDGSISYKNAITKANEKIVQINDRFHILKNLTDYCKEYILRKLNPKIKLETDEKTNQRTDTQEYKKTQSETQSEIEKQKNELISQVKQLKEQGYSNRTIAKIMGLNRKTINKYIKINTSWKHGSKGITKESIIDEYIPTIKKLIQKGYNQTQIYKEIKKEGYRGSYGLVRIHIRRIKPKQKNHYTEKENIQTVKRKSIIQYLYKPISEIKELTEEIITKITDKYEFLKEIYKAVKEFKKILFSKNTEKLHTWIEKYKNSAIHGIQSFIYGIKRDIVAVENAIKYEYSNGLAEGKINKIKLIKRKMYGRCKFETLKNKILMIEHS